jgi:predicted dehydrogenase
VKLGLVGFGFGGRIFHAPFITAADGVDLAGIVTRSPVRRAEAAEEYPEVPLYGSLTELLAAGVDAVVITTPPETRRELVLEAIAAGVHVVADKPFAPNAEVARELVKAAADAGVILNVFHNRRWDTDVRTLRSVLDSGEVGQVARFESRFDFDQPETLEAGPAGGLLRDLGSHLVDQALWLFGPAASVYATLDWADLDAGRTDSGFFVTITHRSGVRSHVSATKSNRLVAREMRLLGSDGSYVSQQSDVQADAAIAGARPVNDPAAWGYEDESRWGTLTTAAGQVRVPSEQGAYHAYYEQLALAGAGKGPQPVPGSEAVHTLEVLDAARLSDAESRSVDIAG